MNKGKNQHVVPHNGKWAVRGEENEKVTKVTDTQAEAIEIAREIAINQQSEVVIHRPNGQIRDKDSYVLLKTQNIKFNCHGYSYKK